LGLAGGGGGTGYVWPYTLCNLCRLLEETVRSRISPQYFSLRPSRSLLEQEGTGGAAGWVASLPFTVQQWAFELSVA
jgi:hypothetical protein